MNGSRKRILVKPLVLAAVSTALIMTTFETLKQAIYPTITVWTSHLITIIFTTAVSVIVTLYALEKYGAVRNQMENEILRLNTDLKVINQELEAFNYTVAHDLRQPLNMLSSYCQMIEMAYGGDLEQECKEYLRDAYKCTVRMNGMIEALLNFSRMGQVVPRRQKVDLGQLAYEVIGMLKLNEPERQVEFIVAQGLIADGEENLLRVALDNLLGNAWKYTRMREKAVIEFGVRDVDGAPAFFVRDNGLGFDPQQAVKLFTPFLRLANAEEYRGFGIGLATVERIVQRHGERIWCEGEPGKGATFYFTLPGSEDTAHPAAS